MAAQAAGRLADAGPRRRQDHCSDFSTIAMNKPQKNKAKRIVRDTQGIEYELTEPLGEGGQGLVCRTDYPGVLVKVSRKPLTDARVQSWFRHVCWVARQPLAGLHIAVPVALIDNQRNPGYVMEVMDGLEPLTRMMEHATQAMQEGSGFSQYAASGGVARRVRLLAKLARILADLHGRGLAYGDLSPANVFVSKSVEHDEVWLIDSDNISVSSREGGQKIWTPQFGAPEILRGISGINSLTDAWSFGILAFQLLTLLHPFKGDLVEEGAAELEVQALRGELPWIDHPHDRSNAGSGSVPREELLTLRLRTLFEQCFNAGLEEPGARPSMAEWAEGFEAGAALLAHCDPEEGCGSSFLFNPRARCPFCSTQLAETHYLRMHHMIFAPMAELGEDATDQDQWIRTPDLQLLQLGHEVELRSSPVGTSIYAESVAVCRLELDEAGLHLTPLSSMSLSLAKVSGGPRMRLTKPFLLKREWQAGATALLHIGDPAAVHTVWRFKW
jgi:serine/threonine protein kinase